MDKNDIIPTSEELQMLRALRFLDHYKNQKKDNNTFAELTSFMSINDSNRLTKLGNAIGSICGMPKEAKNLLIKNVFIWESNAEAEVDGQWYIRTSFRNGSAIYFLKLFLGNEIYIPINIRFKTSESILRFIRATRSTRINANKLILRNSLKEAIWGHNWRYPQYRRYIDIIMPDGQGQRIIEILQSWEANAIQPHISPYTINHTLD